MNIKVNPEFNKLFKEHIAIKSTLVEIFQTIKLLDSVGTFAGNALDQKLINNCLIKCEIVLKEYLDEGV